MVDGVLLSIGGQETNKYGSKKTSSIYGFHSGDQMWKHVGDMPLACSRVDTLLSGGGLFVVDGDTTQQVWKMTVRKVTELFYIEIIHFQVLLSSSSSHQVQMT